MLANRSCTTHDVVEGQLGQPFGRASGGQVFFWFGTGHCVYAAIECCMHVCTFRGTNENFHFFFVQVPSAKEKSGENIYLE